MAVTQAAKLYGFGSFFKADRASANDIDLLVLHESTERASMEFALFCKSVLREAVPKVHVTILSRAEERELDFLTKSGAVRLGEVFDAEARQWLLALVNILISRGAGG